MTPCKHEELRVRKIKAEGAIYPVSVYECRYCELAIGVAEGAFMEAAFSAFDKRLLTIERAISDLARDIAE